MRAEQDPDVPGQAGVQTPMVYVTEREQWEYKVMETQLPAQPSEAALDALGAQGWELAAAVAHGETARFYFKRVRV